MLYDSILDTMYDTLKSDNYQYIITTQERKKSYFVKQLTEFLIKITVKIIVNDDCSY